MTKDELELVPDYIESGKFSWKQAVNELIVFIIHNKPLFGLVKYDEDFISEIIIIFLDRGESALKLYDKSKGTFYTYLFCFVTNICNSIKRSKINSNMIDYHNIRESINEYSSAIEAYENIKYDDFEVPKVPYKYTPISYKDFQIACKTDSYHIKKVISKEKDDFAQNIKQQLKDYSPKMIQNIILVLALKSSYYITEEQIKKIADLFNIDITKLHQIIMEIKKEIEPRTEHRKELEERRNKAYFMHNKLITQIEWNETCDSEPLYPNYVLEKKFKRNATKLKKLNDKLEDGKILVRPTTSLIAKVLGISSRQVTYYQTTARKLGIDINKV